MGGFVLLGVAAAAAGAALVSSSALRSRLFVAVAFPLLVVVGLEVIRDGAGRTDVRRRRVGRGGRGARLGAWSGSTRAARATPGITA